MRKTYWIYGIHAVQAALNNPQRQCHRLCVLTHPETYAQLKQVRVEQVDHKFFKNLFGDQAVHQGIALEVDPLPQITLYDILNETSDQSSLLIALLDQVTDPHNMGAILRSAAAFGITALIVPEHPTPPLTSAVLAKAASGACESVPIISVTNLAQAIDLLKKEGLWILGLDEDGTNYIYEENLQGRYAIVLGAEGRGMRRLTTSSCDILVKLPTAPTFTTLNVSNAAAIAFYEFYRQNTKNTKKNVT